MKNDISVDSTEAVLLAKGYRVLTPLQEEELIKEVMRVLEDMQKNPPVRWVCYNTLRRR